MVKFYGQKDLLIYSVNKILFAASYLAIEYYTLILFNEYDAKVGKDQEFT